MNRAAMLAFRDSGLEPGVLATGCLSLDWALGHGGFPRGHLVEIFGPPDSGKTTLGLEAIAAAQRAGGAGAFLDAEHALHSAHASDIGVDTGGLIYAKPASVHHALGIIRALVKSCAVDVIVLDSVAALGPDSASAAVPGCSGRGGDFDYWPFVHGLRELHAILPKSPCCVIFLNQLRSRLGIEIGSTETSPGAPALHCFASIRVRVERRATITSRGEAIGSRCALKVSKNALGRSGREAEFEISRPGGISREADLMSLGLRAGVIARSPSGLSFGGTSLGASTREAGIALRANPRLFNQLDGELRERAGLNRKQRIAAAAATAG